MRYIPLIAVLGYASPAEAKLAYHNEPIEPYCFAGLFKDAKTIDLAECSSTSISKGESDPAQINIGYQGYAYDSDKNIYVKPLGNIKGYEYVMAYSGERSNLSRMKLEGENLVEIETLASGERCSGGVIESFIKNRKLNFTQRVTSYRLLQALAPREEIKAKDLNDKPDACVGTATFVDGKLHSAHLDNHVPSPHEMSEAQAEFYDEWYRSAPLQGCFIDMFDKLPRALKPKQLETLTQQFIDECGKKESSNGLF